MEILVFGKGGRLRACKERLEGQLSDFRGEITRIAVLPIPTTKDGKTVFGTDILLSDVLEDIGHGTLAACYGIPDECAKKIEDRGGVIYDALYDEKLLSENAYLTALGAVADILTSDKREPRDIALGIVGYGRIGREIAKTWFFLGGVPHIYTGRGEVCEELRRAGMHSSICDGTEDYTGLDILINTAPDGIVKSSSHGIDGVRRIIDLASGNYLEGIPRVEKMPSIPEKRYPESAGRLYADSIINHLGGAK